MCRPASSARSAWALLASVFCSGSSLRCSPQVQLPSAAVCGAARARSGYLSLCSSQSARSRGSRLRPRVAVGRRLVGGLDGFPVPGRCAAICSARLTGGAPARARPGVRPAVRGRRGRRDRRSGRPAFGRRAPAGRSASITRPELANGAFTIGKRAGRPGGSQAPTAQVRAESHVSVAGAAALSVGFCRVHCQETPHRETGAQTGCRTRTPPKDARDAAARYARRRVPAAPRRGPPLARAHRRRPHPHGHGQDPRRPGAPRDHRDHRPVPSRGRRRAGGAPRRRRPAVREATGLGLTELLERLGPPLKDRPAERQRLADGREAAIRSAENSFLTARGWYQAWLAELAADGTLTRLVNTDESAQLRQADPGARVGRAADRAEGGARPAGRAVRRRSPATPRRSTTAPRSARWCSARSRSGWARSGRRRPRSAATCGTATGSSSTTWPAGSWCSTWPRPATAWGSGSPRRRRTARRSTSPSTSWSRCRSRCRRGQLVHACENPAVLRRAAGQLGADARPLDLHRGPAVDRVPPAGRRPSPGRAASSPTTATSTGRASPSPPGSSARHRAQPWRFAAADYEAAIKHNADYVSLAGTPQPTPWAPSLATAMTAHGRAVYEESVAIDDLPATQHPTLRRQVFGAERRPYSSLRLTLRRRPQAVRHPSMVRRGSGTAPVVSVMVARSRRDSRRREKGHAPGDRNRTARRQRSDRRSRYRRRARPDPAGPGAQCRARRRASRPRAAQAGGAAGLREAARRGRRRRARAHAAGADQGRHARPPRC